MNLKFKQIILCISIMLFSFFVNSSNVLAARTSFYPSGQSVSGLTQSGSQYSLDCGGVHLKFSILDIKDNNEQASDCGDNYGVFYDATDEKRVAKLTKEMSESDGKDHYILWARSISWGTTGSITLSINNSTTGKSCSGKITVNPNSGSNTHYSNNSSFQFEYIVTSDETETKQTFNTKVSVDVVHYSGSNEGKSMGDYYIGVTGETKEIAKAMTDYSKTGSEEDKKKAEEAAKDKTETGGSSRFKIPEKTTIKGAGVGTSQKLDCDASLADFISKYWKYVMLFCPILLIVMITLDFFKALFSSDADLMKKATDNAVKRVIAAVLLLCLPLIIDTILNFFGLELCI